MLPEKKPEPWLERREYPRILANCPVRYKIGVEGSWHEATLVDYSATGARIQSDELILKGSKVFIEVVPGQSKRVPLFKAEAIAVRFSLDDRHVFEIGFEFRKPISSLMNTNTQPNH